MLHAMLREEIAARLGLLESSNSEATLPFAYVFAGMALGAGVTWLLMSKPGGLLKAELVQRLHPDRNLQFAEKVNEEEGGLPGPIKHLAP
jgi:hypothetical protein